MADGAACNERARRREPKWAPARQWLRSAAPLAVWDWLVDASSLTRRLQLACGEQFHVAAGARYQTRRAGRHPRGAADVR
jgi:hypothetical protein